MANWAPVSSAFRQVRVSDKQDTTGKQNGWEKLAEMLRQPDQNPIVQARGANVKCYMGRGGGAKQMSHLVDT